MESLNTLKDSVGDSFLTLPILLIGLIFFIGTLTSNIGLLLLFVGHLIVVPALSYLANGKGPPFHNDGQMDGLKTFQSVLSVFLFYGINATAMQIKFDSNYSYLLYFLAACPWLAQYASKSDKSTFNIVNPGAYLIKPTAKGSPTCNIFPNSSADDTYNKPSNWVAHITFFFGFIFANVYAIYNQPVPVVQASGNPTNDKEKQESIDIRVGNRKMLSTTIACISALLFIVLLLFRYRKTDCEENFLFTLVPLSFILITGISWFQIINVYCGVRPADILGIVQGMISQDLLDNPIVCVGSG